MNKPAIFFTILLIAICGVYLYYGDYLKSSEKTAWDFVSDDAAVVLEFQDIKELSTKINHKKTLFHDFIEIKNDSLISSLVKRVAESESTSNNKVLISIHTASNTRLGYTFYLHLDNNQSQKTFYQLLDSLRVTYKSELNSRNYNGIKIYEMLAGKRLLSYLVEENIAVLSFDPFLIEDAVRLILNEQVEPFNFSNSGIMNMPKLSNDDGNIYINLKGIPGLINTFLADRNTDLANFGKGAFMDVSGTDNSILLNGFSTSERGEFLQTFDQQNPVVDRFNYYIPTEATQAYKFLVSDVAGWYDQLGQYWSKSRPEFHRQRIDFLTKFSLEPNEMINWVDNGFCYVNFMEGPEAEQLLFISTNDINEALNRLNSFSESYATLQGDSVYTEQYGDYTIAEIGAGRFPEMVYGPHFYGFKTSYYIALNDMIVIGSTIEILKNLIGSIENEETWGRSVAYNKFYSSGLEEINYSYTYNLQRLWPKLISSLNEESKVFALNHQNLLKSYKLGMMQFSRIDDSFYTNVALKKQEQNTATDRQYFNASQSLALTHKIISKPFVVRNHSTNLREVIFQDSLGNLNLLSNEGRKLWDIPIDDKIISTVEQIDYYNNKKLQFFFSTKNKIFIVDRLGNLVEDYPKSFDFKISDVSVVDYDNSKNYRFLITDELGNLYLSNKHGQLLNGWDPLKVGKKHAFQPFHLRIRGKDCFIILTTDGTLNVVNRRGQNLDNFPINLEGKFSSKLFVEQGSDLKSSILHILNKDGQLTKIDLNGEIRVTEELYKQTKEASFRIIPDALGKTYVVARMEKNRLVILNSDKQEILAKDYLGVSELKIQYYYFSPQNQIYAVTDSEQGFTYLYDSYGTLINSQPINSTQEVGILYSESKNEYTVYTISDDTYRMLTF